MKNNKNNGKINKKAGKESVKQKIISAYYGINFLNPYSYHCYSQDGEELYLAEELGGIDGGFYVDIGAYHPYKFSNTYWAYKRGWSGINIEPNQEGYLALMKHRGRDINLCCGIADHSGKLDYYEFETSAFNTFDKTEFEGKRLPQRIISVPVYRLDELFEKNSVEKIHFMDIDVEGLEMSVLKSNNWDKYRPEFILVEQKNMNLEEAIKSDIYIFLQKYGYKCEWKSLRTMIYKKY